MIGLVLAFLALALPLSAAKLVTPPATAPQITQAGQPPAPPPSELPKIVEQLAAQPSLSAADCEKFARETITDGQNTRQSGQPVKPGIVQDGLAAVERGEALDPKTTDWPELRRQLEELLKPPPQQDQKNQDEQKQEQQQQEQQKQDQQQKQQDQQEKQDQNQQEQSQQQQQQDQQSEQQKQQEQQQPPQPQQQPPPQDTQKVGGEKPKDDEAKEHPELALPLQKLEQVRDKDSPAELFELLHSDEPKSSDQPKKDW